MTKAPAPVPQSPSIDLYSMLELEPDDSAANSFIGAPVPGPYDRIFGGQLIGQTVMAATATVDAARGAHSLHAYFVRAGTTSRPITYTVETVRDGRSFSVRSIKVHQDDRLLLTAAISFHELRPGMEHQVGLVGRYPDPDDLSEDNHSQDAPRSQAGNPGHRTSVELRRVPPEKDPAAPGRRAGQAVWFRARSSQTKRLNHSPAVERASLAMATDFTILESVVYGHGMNFATPSLTVASLDHSVWWHAPSSLNDWSLYVQESPWAGGQRGLVIGRIYDRSGALLASVSQEGLVRVASSSWRSDA